MIWLYDNNIIEFPYGTLGEQILYQNTSKCVISYTRWKVGFAIHCPINSIMSLHNSLVMCSLHCVTSMCAAARDTAKYIDVCTNRVF